MAVLNTLSPIPQSPQYTTESRVRGMDFTADLASSGDTLTGTPTATATCLNNVDTGNPLSLTLGTPALSANNLQILVRVSGGLAGALYALAFKCDTVQGDIAQDDAQFYIVQG